MSQHPANLMAKSLYIIRHPSHTNRYHISEREAGFDFFISFALGAGCCIRAHKDREGAKAIIVAAGFAESLMSFDMKGTLFDSFSQSSFPIPLPTSVHEISISESLFSLQCDTIRSMLSSNPNAFSPAPSEKSSYLLIPYFGCFGAFSFVSVIFMPLYCHDKNV